MSAAPAAVPVADTPAPGRWERHEWWWLLGALLLGGLLRWWMRPLVVWPLGDAVHYLNQARFGPFTGTWSPVGETWWLPPLYPWLVSLGLGGSTDPDLTLLRGVQVNCLVGALLPCVLYGIARQLAGCAAARWTLVLAVTDPFLVTYSATCITEPLYMLLLMALLACALAWAAGHERASYGVVVLGFLLYATRAFGVVMFPLTLLGVAWARQASFPLDRCFFKHALAAALLYCVLLGVMVGIVQHTTGEVALDGKSRYQFMRLAAPDLASETPDPNYEGQVDASHLRYAPTTPWFEPLSGHHYWVGQAKKYLLRQRRLWGSYLTAAIPPYSTPLFHPLLLVLTGAGGWSLLRPGANPGWRIVGALAGGVLLIQPLTFVEPRYFVALSPLALPLAGAGLAGLVSQGRALVQSALDPVLFEGSVALGCLAASLLVLAPTASWTRGADIQYNAPREAAAVLRESGPVPERILDTAGVAAYYLGAEGLAIPDIGPEELAPFAAAHGATALVLDERIARGKHNRALLQFFYDVPDDYPEYGLQLVRWEEHPEGRSWRVYRFIPVTPRPEFQAIEFSVPESDLSDSIGTDQ